MDLGKAFVSIICALMLTSCGGIATKPVNAVNDGHKKPGGEPSNSYGKARLTSSQVLSPAIISGLSLVELNRVLDLSFNSGATRQDPSCYDVNTAHRQNIKKYIFDYRPAKCSLNKYSPKGIEELKIELANDIVQTVDYQSKDLNFKYHSSGIKNFQAADKVVILNNSISIQRVSSEKYRARIQLDISSFPYDKTGKGSAATAEARWKTDTYIEFDFTTIGGLGITAKKIVSDIKLDVEGKSGNYWSDTKVEFLQDKQNGLFRVSRCGLPMGTSFYTHASKTKGSSPGVLEYKEDGLYSSISNVKYEWSQLSKDQCFQGLRPLLFNFIASNAINE